MHVWRVRCATRLWLSGVALRATVWPDTEHAMVWFLRAIGCDMCTQLCAGVWLVELHLLAGGA